MPHIYKCQFCKDDFEDRHSHDEHVDHAHSKLYNQSTVPSLEFNARVNKPRTAKVGAISKAQNLKGGPFGLCETPAGCKKF